MTWLGPRLGQEHDDLRRLVDDVVASLPAEDAVDPQDVRQALARAGLWTLGVPESAGGGGGDDAMTVLVQGRIAHRFAALAWASVQAHAAAHLLAGDDRIRGVVDGSLVVAVVDAASGGVDLDVVDGRLSGSIVRVDAGGAADLVIVVFDDRTVYVLTSDDIAATPLTCTGLTAAGTASLAVVGADVAPTTVDDGAVAGARRQMALGAAAVAAGLAEAATTAAQAYSQTRHQFGGPLTHIQTVREGLLAQTDAVRSMMGAVFSAAADPHAAADGLARTNADVAIDVCAAAVQSLGGYGYLSEYPVEKLLRDAVSLRAAAGVVESAESAARDLVGATPELA